MNRFAALLLLSVACSGQPSEALRYWSCDETTTCVENTECTELQYETSYCTTECSSHQDCNDSGWPSVCIQDPDGSANHCYGECWPMDTGPDYEGEDLEFCRKYGFLCPSDCAAQGLVCDFVGGWPPRYSCIPNLYE